MCYSRKIILGVKLDNSYKSEVAYNNTGFQTKHSLFLCSICYERVLIRNTYTLYISERGLEFPIAALPLCKTCSVKDCTKNYSNPVLLRHHSLLPPAKFSKSTWQTKIKEQNSLKEQLTQSFLSSLI